MEIDKHGLNIGDYNRAVGKGPGPRPQAPKDAPVERSPYFDKVSGWARLARAADMPCSAAHLLISASGCLAHSRSQRHVLLPRLCFLVLSCLSGAWGLHFHFPPDPAKCVRFSSRTLELTLIRPLLFSACVLSVPECPVTSLCPARLSPHPRTCLLGLHTCLSVPSGQRCGR